MDKAAGMTVASAAIDRRHVAWISAAAGLAGLFHQVPSFHHIPSEDDQEVTCTVRLSSLRRFAAPFPARPWLRMSLSGRNNSSSVAPATRSARTQKTLSDPC